MSDSKSGKSMQVFTLRVRVPAELERSGTPTMFPFEVQVRASDEASARTEIGRLFKGLPYTLIPLVEPVHVEQLPVHLARKMTEAGYVRLRAVEPVATIEEGIERSATALTAPAVNA